VNDATTSTKGIVQLAGDLGGTASGPSVLKVNGIGVSGTPSSGQVLTASSSSAASWQAPSSAPVTSVAGKTGVVTLVKGDVGLGNIDNTSDVNKPVSTATQTALNLKAPLASPTFTGTVTVPTPTNGTDASTKAYVDSHTGVPVAVQDEGSTLTSSATNVNFVGSGVTATNSGSNVTVTIAGGSGLALGSATPAALGTAAAGTSANAAHDDHVYRVIEIVGTSEESIDDAIRSAVARAEKTLRHLRWFEVVRTSGHIANGEVEHFQVTLKVGFNLEAPN